MKSNLKHVLELIGISLRVVAACIGILLFSVYFSTMDSDVGLVFGIVTLISWDIYMLRTIIETFMPEFEYKDIGRKKFGSCVIWGYVLSIAATIIMVLNGWFIFAMLNL